MILLPDEKRETRSGYAATLAECRAALLRPAQYVSVSLSTANGGWGSKSSGPFGSSIPTVQPPCMGKRTSSFGCLSLVLMTIVLPSLSLKLHG
jgi:hypothetical protein